MDNQLNVSTNCLGQKVFEIQVGHPALTIDSIVNAILYGISIDFPDEVPNSFWDWCNRENVLRLLSVWLIRYGDKFDNPRAYLRERRSYGEVAQKFAEELFPELVYDRKIYIQKMNEMRRKIRKKNL